MKSAAILGDLKFWQQPWCPGKRAGQLLFFSGCEIAFCQAESEERPTQIVMVSKNVRGVFMTPKG